MRRTHYWLRIGIPILLLIIILNGAGIFPLLVKAQAATDATISVSIPGGPYTIGQVINVNILVNTVPQTRSAGIAISFNPAVLRCDRITEGTFYKNWASANGASTIVSPVGVINNSTGTVSETDVVLLGGPTDGIIIQGPTGSGVILSYQFTVRANGISNITITTANLTDNHAQIPQLLTVAVENGILIVGPTPISTFTPSRTASLTPTRTLTPTPTRSPTPTATVDLGALCPRADVNQDGMIDLLDFLQVSGRIGQTGAPGWIPEDFNRDGIVDIRDLSAMSPCMNRSLTPYPTPMPGSAVVSLQPASQSVKRGQSVSVAIMLNVSGVSTAAQAGLRFDPAILRCEKITEGNFYKSWLAQNAPAGSTQFFPPPQCDNTTGRVTAGALYMSGSPAGQGPSGSGSLFTITFTAVETGLSSLQLTDAWVLDNHLPIGQPLSISTFNGQVNVLTGGPNVMMSVQPSLITGKKVGDALEFTVNISTDAATRGAQAGIYFDPTVLRCTDVKEGDFFKTWATDHNAITTFYPPASIDNTHGQISSAVVALVGGNGGASGSGVFLSVKCTIIGSRSGSDLLLANYVVSDAASPPSPLPLQVNNGRIGEIVAPTPTTTPTSTKSPTSTPMLGRVFLDPASPIIKPGVTFDIALKVDTTVTTNGMNFEAAFDKTILECQSITQGTFFSDWVNSHTNYNPTLVETPAPACDNANGKITLGGIGMIGIDIPNGQGPSGSGTIYVLRFKSLAVGVSSITLSNVILSDATLVGTPPRAQPIPIGVNGSHVTVSTTAASLTPTVANQTSIAQTQAAAHLTQTAQAPATQTAAVHQTETRAANVPTLPGGTSSVRTATPIPSNGSLSISPLQKVVGAPGDDVFSMDIVINIDKPTRGGSFKVKYDPTVLSCVKIVEGNFYKDWTKKVGAQTLMIPTPSCNDAAGSTSVIGISILGGPTADPLKTNLVDGATGTGVVVSVQFKAKKVGSSKIELTDVSISDNRQQFGGYYSLTIVNGGVYVGVTPPPSPTPNPSLNAASTGAAGGTLTPTVSGTPGTATPGTGTPESSEQATGSVTNAVGSSQASITGGKPVPYDLSNKLDANGVLLEDVEFASDDGILILRLLKGSQALTADNHRLKEVTIRKLDSFPQPQNGFQTLNLAYELGPDGATFDPPASLVFRYAKANLPERVNEKVLALTSYDLDHNQWNKLKGKLDTQKQELTADLAHFSIYSLMEQKFVISRGVWIGASVFLELLIAAGIVVYLRRRKKRNMLASAANSEGVTATLPKEPALSDPVDSDGAGI